MRGEGLAYSSSHCYVVSANSSAWSKSKVPPLVAAAQLFVLAAGVVEVFLCEGVVANILSETWWKVVLAVATMVTLLSMQAAMMG
ncbi:MAG: hypothetical protein IPL81_06780 [Flavobacteriales bacterium]|nr:hypothetical protein [Flavobacteriales bacterium]